MSNIGLPVPTDYKLSSTDLLYKLIEYSNPGFTAQFPKGTIQFSAPTSVSVVAGDAYNTDTTVTVSSAPGAGKIGNQTIRYRRIDMTTIFKSMVIKLTDYSAGTTLAEAVWKGSFRSQYGINIVDADFTNTGAINGGNTTIAIKATSLCYKGSFVLNWVSGKRLITSIITDANRALVGRLYPGGNDFTTAGRKPQGEFLVYCQDASSLKTLLEALASSSAPSSTDSTVTQVVNFLLANTSRTDWNTGTVTESGGITGVIWYKYTLPNVAIPEGNSAKYTRCIVIQSGANSWFAGKIIIHYNA